ncbi:MAG: aminotransferase class I/II-fold pyridoxal phosphate-dependent enzyme [Gemmataceae bacterium]
MDQWLSDRTKLIELSGIRKVFELGKSLKNPVNLSIGQPHFDVPAPIKAAAKAAIDSRANGYSVTQGIPELRERLLADVRSRFPHLDHSERDVLVTSGTSGGLILALLATVNPGEEVITADPYFVAYPHMITLAGGRMVAVDADPHFRIDPAKIEAAITPRTKAVMLSSPSNPTGAVISAADQDAIAGICRKHKLVLISDEIYRAFHYDAPAASPLAANPDALIVEGFGKTYGITGWRLGWVHGPKAIVNEMAKLQQFTYVCAPSMAQAAGVAALEYDTSAIVADYKRKRDRLTAALAGRYEFATPGGAFYLFAKAPWGTGTEFVAEAIRNNLLIIPGGTFSARDTHFRISYAASDETLDRGIEILLRLASGPAR